MNIIVCIENKKNIFIPVVFELLAKVKQNNNAIILTDKYMQIYFLKYDQIIDLLEKEKEFFSLTRYFGNTHEQIFNNLSAVHVFHEKIIKTGIKVDNIEVHGIDSIMTGILLQKFLDIKIKLYLNFIPQAIIKKALLNDQIVDIRLLKYGCDQAERIYTLSEEIKEYLIFELLIPSEKIEIYTPIFFHENNPENKKENLIFGTHEDLFINKKNKSMIDMIKNEKIKYLISNMKSHEIYKDVLKNYGYQFDAEFLLVDEFYSYSLHNLLKIINNIYIINDFIKDSFNEYFKLYLRQNGITLKEYYIHNHKTYKEKINNDK